MSFSSPPTTSGVVVLSGSLGFDPTLSDFPVPTNLVRFSSPSYKAYKKYAEARVAFPPDHVGLFGGSSTVTTSGVVVWTWAFGAGAPYVPPFVYNARIFPVSTAVFPTTVSGERVYPVLPQFSTIIP